MSSKSVIKKNKKAIKELEKNDLQEKLNFDITASDVRNVKRSPSEQELDIQRNRILDVFDKIIKKVKAAVCLPMLLEDNNEILCNHLRSAELELVYFVLTTEYSNFFISQPVSQNISISKDLVSAFENTNLSILGITEPELFNNPAMLKAFEIVWLNPELNEFLLNKFKHLDNPLSVNFINTIMKLKEVVSSKLAEKGSEKVERERSLRRAWKFNSKIKEELSKIEKKHTLQMQSFRNVLQTKTALVKTYQKAILKYKLNFKKEAKVICMNSENEMMEDSRASEVRQEDLSEESKNTQQQYETLLQKNVGKEKILRAKKLKVESQLTSWLTKFDSDIGDRQAEFDIITTNFEEEKTELINLREEFFNQEIEYNILMAEKQEEDFQIWAEKVIIFIKNRSARTIQRAWKAYKIRKIAKRLKRKAHAKARAEKKGGAAVKGAKKK